MIKDIIGEFKRRALWRRIIGYSLLSTSILLIFLSVVLVILHLQEMANQKEVDIYNIISRLSYITFAIYTIQILQRLYRYNIIKGDYYISCADTLIIMEAFTDKDTKKFNSILTTLNGNNVNLTDTEAPNISFAEKGKSDQK